VLTASAEVRTGTISKSTKSCQFATHLSNNANVVFGWGARAFCREPIEARDTVRALAAGASAVRQHAGQSGQNARAPQSLEFFIYLRERINREFQVFARMRGGDLRADARGAVWNDRIKEADHVNSFLQHARGELL
jgi:hypothetical protein